jgi:hypothetical protein
MLGVILTSDTARGRIIPILCEGRPSLALPRYLKSKLYVDFTNDEQYDFT